MMADSEKPQKAKNLGGRPTKYNKEIAEIICERVATHDCGLPKLCAMYDDMPDRDTINLWRHVHQEFSAKYACAKMKQAELLAESIDDLAAQVETYIDSEGNIRPDPGSVAKQRLLIDTRKWLACKLAPKIYGDRVTHDGKITISHEDALKELE